ncbi:MAG: hypothetical protein R3F11_13510 [Verrucomicrobiales bacterium]
MLRRANRRKRRAEAGDLRSVYLFARHTAAHGLIDPPIEWRMASRTRILQGIQRLYGVGDT